MTAKVKEIMSKQLWQQTELISILESHLKPVIDEAKKW